MVCNPFRTAAIQIGIEYPLYRGRFLWDDFKIFLVHDPIAVRCRAGDKFPSFHSSLITYFLISRDGNGFLLGQRTGNAHHQFGGERFRVDIFFFKLDRDTQSGQFTQSGEAILGIAGEAGYRLYQNAVDLALPAISHHTVEIIPLVHPGAGQPFVGIHIHQLPAVMLGDLLRVAADLCGVGMQLILGVRTDPAVGRHPQALRLNRLGFDHFHRGHQRSSRWWAAIASLRFTQPCRSSMKVFRADGLSNPLM